MRLDEVSPSYFKTPASRDVSKVPPSSSKTPDSGHRTSWKEGHFLIPASRKSVCFHCKKRSKSKCPNCDKHFCNVIRTGRDCFNSYHEAFARETEEKSADDEMSSDELDEEGMDDELDEDIGQSISNTTNAVQVLDEVFPSHFKTPDSRDISAPKHHASWKDCHILIGAARRGVCYYCKKRSKNKCPNCNKHFCNVSRTGRDCFNSYHKAEKFADIERSSDRMVEDIGHSISNNSDSLLVLDDDDDSDLEIISETKQGQSNTDINHTPVFVEDKKVCFYCKTEGSNWRCKTCSKSLCNQKTGKTCFHLFHSSPSQAKRPNMKYILQAYARKSH